MFIEKRLFSFFFILFIFLTGCTLETSEMDGQVFIDIDRLLMNGQIIKAKKDIASYSEKAKNSTQFKSLLKRSLRISMKEDDFTFYSNIAEKAVKRLPGNHEFWFCLAYGKMRMGQYDEALEIAEKRLKDSKYNYLKGEINLKKELNIQEENNSTINIDVNPEVYERLGYSTGDDRFFLNAGLLWLVRGDFEKAVATLGHGRNNYYFFEILARIHYLQGNYKDAAEYLEKIAILEPERKDITHVLGDINMFLRNYEKAENFYYSIINTRPELYWKPYFNILYLQEPDKRDEFEKQFYPFLIKEFKGAEYVLGKYISYLLRNKDMVALRGILEQQSEPLDPYWEMLRITYLSTEGKVKKIARLWDLFNKFPDTKDIAEELVLHSFRIRDYQGAERVINQYYNASEDTNWYFLYDSLLKAFNGEFSNALRILKQENPENWIRMYNLSALYVATGDYAGARELLLKAENQLLEEKETESLNYYKSLVFTRLGEIEIKLHNFAVAYRNLQEALKLDSDNEKAIFLLKSIEKR